MTARCELTDLIKDQCAHCRNIPDDVTPRDTAPIRGRDKELGVFAEDLMIVMNTNIVMQNRRILGGKLPLRHFDRAEPFTGDELELTHADVREEAYFRDATLWDLPARLDMSIVTRPDSPRNGEDYVIRRWREVRRPRIAVRNLTRRVVECSHMEVFLESGIAIPNLYYLGVNRPGDPWRALDPCEYRVRHDGHDDTDKVTQGQLDVTIGMQFTRDYTWRVHLKRCDADIGVMVPTTVDGIRKLFRLRDYEAGESRRKALTHWVKAHSRRVNKGSDAERLAWVRKHLRGRESFTWQDMRGVIYPAPYDLRQLEAAK